MLQGAERPVRLPQDLERFQHLPMLVTFQLEDSSKYVAVLSSSGQSGVWNMLWCICL